MTDFCFGWPKKTDRKAWLTVGNFDGFHLGHQSLIEFVRSQAIMDQADSVLLTFWPHPRVFLEKIRTPFYLTTREEKELLLRQSGLNLVMTLPFDDHLAQKNAAEFFDELTAHINITGFSVGDNFVLGRGRSGTIEAIKAICAQKGITFKKIEPLRIDNQVVSSQRVRQALEMGAMEEVTKLLGRLYSITGEVKQGRQLGSKLGIPTANQYMPIMKLLPRFGVYATWAIVNDQKLMGVTSVGVRPTFEKSDQPSVETLLLDFDDNIYGEELTVEFIHRLRDERKFATASDLIRQIEQDKINARRILTHGLES